MDSTFIYCLEKFTLPKWCLQSVQNRSGPDHTKEMLGSGLHCSSALPSVYLAFVCLFCFSEGKQHVARLFRDNVTTLSPCFE